MGSRDRPEGGLRGARFVGKHVPETNGVFRLFLNDFNMRFLQHGRHIHCFLFSRWGGWGVSQHAPGSFNPEMQK